MLEHSKYDMMIQNIGQNVCRHVCRRVCRRAVQTQDPELSYINSTFCVWRRVCRRVCRKILRNECHCRLFRPYMDSRPFSMFPCPPPPKKKKHPHPPPPPTRKTFLLKYSVYQSEIEKVTLTVNNAYRWQYNSVNILFPCLNRWDLRHGCNWKYFSFVVGKEWRL